ncbi:MAG: YegS/Rv2252/BmrU family lipid kinase [Cyanobacteria bacterium P01_H01_bin.58]
MSSSLAFLAHASQVANLMVWMKQYRDTLSAFQILTTDDLAQRFQSDLHLVTLSIQVVHSIQDGGDIQLAAHILSEGMAGMVFFVDSETVLSENPSLAMLLRACKIQNVPVALNEATADLAIRGWIRSRVAYLIFNPVAGQGNPNQDIALIRNILEPQVLVNVIMTRPDVNPADQTREAIATIQAESGDPGMRLIIASGGDGTVSAVAGAVIGTDIPLGVIPRGTANAFSVALGIPTSLKEACETILAGNTRVIDTARCNDTPMILLAGLGFEAGMVDKATRELKNRLGAFAYVLAGVQQFADQEIFQATLEIDGKTSKFATNAITIANVAPPTSVLAQGFGAVIPDDGLLEVTIDTSQTAFQGVNTLTSLVTSAVVKSPAQNKDIICLRASHIKVLTNPPQKLVVDGEILESNPIEFECLPKSLTVFAPLPAM